MWVNDKSRPSLRSKSRQIVGSMIWFWTITGFNFCFSSIFMPTNSTEFANISWNFHRVMVAGLLKKILILFWLIQSLIQAVLQSFFDETPPFSKILGKIFCQWRIGSQGANSFSAKTNRIVLKPWILKENEKILKFYKTSFEIDCQNFLQCWIFCLKISCVLFEIWQLCHNFKNAKFRLENLQKIHFFQVQFHANFC